MSAPERAPLVVEASLEPRSSPPGDIDPPTREDARPRFANLPEPIVEPVVLVEAPSPPLAPAAPLPAREPRGVVIASGIEISLTLEHGLSTRDSRPGDAFYARVTDDVLDGGGMVLVPLGARVRGKVVESRSSNSADRHASIELVMESLIADGRNYPMVATVLETEMSAEKGESTGRTAAKIGVGVAAGAILGKLFGRDTEAAVAGAVAGAAAGTAAALSARVGHANILEGSTLVIRLDVPIELDPS